MILKLENGAEPRLVVGTTQHGIVMAYWSNEYVVWAWHIGQDGKVYCEHGDYFKTCPNQPMDIEVFKKARKRFIERAKRWLGADCGD